MPCTTPTLSQHSRLIWLGYAHETGGKHTAIACREPWPSRHGEMPSGEWGGYKLEEQRKTIATISGSRCHDMTIDITLQAGYDAEGCAAYFNHTAVVTYLRLQKSRKLKKQKRKEPIQLEDWHDHHLAWSRLLLCSLTNTHCSVPVQNQGKALPSVCLHGAQEIGRAHV